MRFVLVMKLCDMQDFQFVKAVIDSTEQTAFCLLEHENMKDGFQHISLKTTLKNPNLFKSFLCDELSDLDESDIVDLCFMNS